MAGSKKYFIYTTDLGEDFALLLDESNTEAVNGGTQDFLNGTSNAYELPRNVKPRFVTYANPNKTRNIRCVCLTPGIYNGVIGGAVTSITDPIDPQGTLTLIRATSEKIRLPYGLDTGLNDGDDT